MLRGGGREVADKRREEGLEREEALEGLAVVGGRSGGGEGGEEDGEVVDVSSGGEELVAQVPQLLHGPTPLDLLRRRAADIFPVVGAHFPAAAARDGGEEGRV